MFRFGAPVAIALSTMLAAPAAAQLAPPDCRALGAWAESFDRTARWTPNATGSRFGMYAHFATSETARLFGKPVLEWTVAESRSLDAPFLDCGRVWQKGGNRDVQVKLQQLRINVVNEIPNYLTALQQARPYAESAVGGLQNAEPSLQLLGFLGALRTVARDAQAYAAASRSAGLVPGAAQAPARALVVALRDLPAEEIGRRVAPLVARIEPMRAGVQQKLIAEVGTIQPSLPGLQSLDQFGRAVRQQYAPVLGADGVRAIDRAIGARKAAIGDEMTVAMLGELGKSSEGPDGFADIDQIADQRVLAVLTPEQTARVRQAADGRRKVVADGLFRQTERSLAALPQADESLDVIDNQVLPGIRAWPASAAEVRPRFEQAATARRAEIVRALNRSESGALRGRVYEGRGTTLEFVDRTRVFVKDGGRTAAGTYTEERDGRVVIVVDNNSTVFTREGRRLVGGSAMFKRSN